MAEVLAVVGARLNSSRLPRKQLLDLAGRPLIARLFERLDQVSGLDRAVLATTADDYNRALVEWGRSAGREVFAFAGDVNDLVGRVDALVRRENPGIVCYICGDSPLIEPATLARLIAALRSDPQADIAGLAPPPAGHEYIHEGFQVYRRRAWDLLVSAATTAPEREHVGASLRHAMGQLHFVTVQEEPIFFRRNHRISVDTQADYRFMAELYRRWYAAHPSDAIVSLAWVIEELERDPALAAINRHVQQKQVGERSRRILVATAAGPHIGLGHLRRALVATRAMQERLKADVQLVIEGTPLPWPELESLRHRWVADLPSALASAIPESGAEALLFDLPKRDQRVAPLLPQWRAAGVALVGIDCLTDAAALVDLIHVPSFYLPPQLLPLARSGKLRFGWDAYLIEPESAPASRPEGALLVYLGGGDPLALGQTLPAALDALLPGERELLWVQGPFAETPLLPSARTRWQAVRAPHGLAALAARAGHALAVYGVGAFELLAHGVPSVVLCPYADHDPEELAAFEAAGVAVVARDPVAAVAALAHLTADSARAQALAARARTLLAPGGAQRLADAIGELLEKR